VWSAGCRSCGGGAVAIAVHQIMHGKNSVEQTTPRFKIPSFFHVSPFSLLLKATPLHLVSFASFQSDRIGSSTYPVCYRLCVIERHRRLVKPPKNHANHRCVAREHIIYKTFVMTESWITERTKAEC
jgi:hypothetical protein